MTELSPLRVGRITGSRVSKILGKSPYGDRASVLREMVRERLGGVTEFTGNIATQWGLDHENEAITEYERYRGVMVTEGQEIAIHPTHDYLAVTPDGLVGDAGMVEVKCPYRAGYISIEDRPDYFEQIQLQLHVTGRAWSDFVVWRTTGISVSTVLRDDGWLTQHRGEFEEFMVEYETIIANPDLAAPFLDATGPDERDDFDWQLAAVEYLEANAALKRAETARDTARGRLIELAGDEPARGGGVLLLRTERKGSVDYAKAVKENLPGVDLEPYRKAGSVVVSVRVAS
jgi:hypothetical protein